METLADKIKRDGALNELDAVGWAIRLAKRIELLHSRGISHGGVTPASVRVDGVSRASHGVLADAQPETGTLSFHSPERVTAGGRSPSDDTWAVAATLYAVLTGQEPFSGGDAQEVRQKILAATVAPLAVYDIGDDDLQRVLDDALARDIKQRIVQISALREALETWHPDPTTRDLPPLQEDEDYDDDEATMMRPAMFPLLGTSSSSKRASQPHAADKRDAPKPVPAPSEPASSDEATSAPGTHPSGGGPPNPSPPSADHAAPAPNPASVPRAAGAAASRTAPGAAPARAAVPRLLARKPAEGAAATPAQRSPLRAAPLAAPIIREITDPATSHAAEVPTTVRSSVVKVHDDEDDEATVMREGLVAVIDARRQDEAEPRAGEGITAAADSPPDTVQGESRNTQVSPEMPVPAAQAASASSGPAAIDRSEATLLLPSDGPADSKFGAADTLPAPPASAASREVARVGEALRASPVAPMATFAPAEPAAMAGPPSQSSGYGPHAYGQPGVAGYGAPPQSHPQPPAAGFAPASGPWSPPRQSIPPRSRLLPAILVAVVVLIVAAFTAFALLRYRATGRVLGAAPSPRAAPAASFRNT